MIDRRYFRILLCACLSILVVGCTSTTKKTGSTKPPLSPPPQIAPIPDNESTSAYYTVCNGKKKELGALLKPIVSSMVDQKIPYPPYKFSRRDSNQWRDCSGNFLRITSHLAGTCAEFKQTLVAPGGVQRYQRGRSNIVPLSPSARSTRNIAKWFHDQPNFLFQAIYYDDVNATPRRRAISGDLRKYRHLIRPGAVLWFAHTMPISDKGLSALFTYNETTRRHINHMGIVTSVKRDSKGQVVSLSMYHGRNPRVDSGITTHDWAYSGNSDYPPFGVGSQFLVAIGAVAPVLIN